MKAAPFAYVRPATVDDVLTELGSGEDAKVLAGGQSLVPVLAMRLARPGTLIDINAVAGLGTVEDSDDALRVGATVRQRHIEHLEPARGVPLLGMALPWVGHRELRSRGTVCGSLAHADPAAELPAVATCLNASLEVAGPHDRRTVAARQFFTAAMTTQVGADELLTSVSFPKARRGEGFGFGEVARRHGDFALAGVVVRVATSDSASPTAEVTCFGIDDTPVWRDISDTLRAALAQVGDDAPERELNRALTAGASALAEDVVNTGGDAHGSTGYRRRLITALGARELARAFGRAQRTTRLEAVR